MFAKRFKEYPEVGEPHNPVEVFNGVQSARRIPDFTRLPNAPLSGYRLLTPTYTSGLPVPTVPVSTKYNFPGIFPGGPIRTGLTTTGYSKSLDEAFPTPGLPSISTLIKPEVPTLTTRQFPTIIPNNDGSVSIVTTLPARTSTKGLSYTSTVNSSNGPESSVPTRNLPSTYRWYYNIPDWAIIKPKPAGLPQGAEPLMLPQGSNLPSTYL